MNRPHAMLWWEYWTHSRGLIKFIICTFTGLCVLSLKWPLLVNNPITFVVCLLASSFACQQGNLIQNHHFLLPLSSSRIAFIAYSYCLVVSTACATIALTLLRFFGLEFGLFPGILVSGFLSLSTLALASWFRNQEQAASASFAIPIGTAFLGAQSPWLRLSDTGSWDGAVYLGVYLFGGAVSFCLLLWNIHTRRRGVRSLAERFHEFEKRLGEVRFPIRRGTGSRNEAILALDWRRNQEMVWVIALIVLVSTAAIGLFVDLKSAVVGTIVFGAYCTPMLYFLTSSMNVFEARSHGGFRWTLPVTDVEIAYGVIRSNWRLVLTLWSLWVAVLGILSFLAWATSTPLLAADHRFSSISLAQQIALTNLVLMGTLITGWLALSFGSLNALLASNHATKVMLWLGGVVISSILLTVYVFPSEFQFLFLQTVCGGIGVVMIASVVRVFFYATRASYIGLHHLWRFVLPGCAVGISMGSSLYSLDAGHGVALLATGIASLTIHPFASLPLACHIRRHWNWWTPESP